MIGRRTADSAYKWLTCLSVGVTRGRSDPARRDECARACCNLRSILRSSSTRPEEHGRTDEGRNDPRSCPSGISGHEATRKDVDSLQDPNHPCQDQQHRDDRPNGGHEQSLSYLAWSVSEDTISEQVDQRPPLSRPLTTMAVIAPLDKTRTRFTDLLLPGDRELHRDRWPGSRPQVPHLSPARPARVGLDPVDPQP